MIQYKILFVGYHQGADCSSNLKFSGFSQRVFCFSNQFENSLYSFSQTKV